MASTFMIELYRLSRAFISTIRVKLWNLNKHYGIPDIYMSTSADKYLMDVLTVLSKAERHLTGSRFRPEWGRDVSCLVPIHHCGELDNEKNQQWETRYTLEIYVAVHTRRIWLRRWPGAFIQQTKCLFHPWTTYGNQPNIALRPS